MESLLLHGRAPIQEDALTAALADLLDDLGEPGLLADLLARIRAVGRGRSGASRISW